MIICGDVLMLPASRDIKLVFTSVDTSRRLHFGLGGCGTRGHT